MTTLSIDNVSVARGPRNVVHDVSIEVPPGEVTTILGPERRRQIESRLGLRGTGSGDQGLDQLR